MPEWESVLNATQGTSFWDTPKVIVLEIIAVIICIILDLISAIVIITTCEFYIVANVGILLIALAGSQYFKEYAINVMKYIISVALKLFVLQLVVNIGFTLLTMASIEQATAGGVKVIQYQQLFVIVGQGIILLALAMSLPQTCAGILSGATIGGGNPLMSAVRATGGAAMAGVGYALGAAKSAAAAKSSWSSAKSTPSMPKPKPFYKTALSGIQLCTGAWWPFPPAFMNGKPLKARRKN